MAHPDYADYSDDSKDSETRTLELPPILAVVVFYRVFEVGEQALLIRNSYGSQSLKRCCYGHVRHRILLLSFGIGLSHDVPE